MIWLIALGPAVLVYLYIVASGRKSAMFWAPFCGLVVAAYGPPSYFILDAGAMAAASAAQ